MATTDTGGSHAVHAYLLGDDLPQLAAALELAEVGLRVRIAPATNLETIAAERAWDLVGGRDPDGVLAALLEHVAAPIAAGGPRSADAAPVTADPAPTALLSGTGAWASQPAVSALGVPAVPLAEEVVGLLGQGAATRAYLDRLKPVLTVGKTRWVGELVRKRMGAKALATLVEPVAFEEYGVSADEVEVAVAVPGLNEALTRAGSLSGAVLLEAERTATRERTIRPHGGWAALRDALRERLRAYGVTFAEAPASAFERVDAETWSVSEDGVRVPASAVVHGVAGGAAPGVAERETALARRQWARVRLADEPAPDAPAGRDILALAPLPSGDRVAVRVHAGIAVPGTWAEVLGAAAPEPAGLSPADIDAALACVGRTRDAATAPTIATRAAPFATTQAREAAAVARAQRRERTPDLLEVGAELHGGSLADAVADAREQAVQMRRRLTGIAENG